MRTKPLTGLLIAFLNLIPVHGRAEGVWHVSPEHNAIALLGEIGPNSAVEFKAHIEQHPEVSFLMLGSPGGNVIPALEIADEVHNRGLNTWIHKDLECYSACANIFLAGHARRADGTLGVHQISGSNDTSMTQVVVARIYDRLMSYGVHRGVLNRMFETPLGEMHIFTPDEIAQYQINRTAPPPPEVPADQNSGEVILDTVAQLDSGSWQALIMRNRQNGHYLCAMQSVEDAPRFRLVSYLTKTDAFAEFLIIPLPLNPANDLVSFHYLSLNKDPMQYSLNWQISDPHTAWFNVRSEEVGLMILTPLALYRHLKLESNDGRLLGLYDLTGSLKAAKAFSNCILSTW